MRPLVFFYGIATLTCLAVAIFGCTQRYRSEPPAYQAPPALMRLDHAWLIAHSYQVEVYDPQEHDWVAETRHLTQAEAIDAARRLRDNLRRETIATNMGDSSDIIAWYRP